MKNHAAPFWVLTADRRQARILEGSLTEHGRLHLDLRTEIKEEWEEHQHGRPSSRAGNSGHSYASQGHEDEERTHRFAKNLSRWLEAELDRHDIEELHTFSARRLLGELRQVLPERLRGRIRDHALDLAHLSPGELAAHAAVGVVALEASPMVEGGS